MFSPRLAISAIACFIAATTIYAAHPLIELPVTSTVSPGYGLADSISARMSRQPLAPLEGIWELTADGAIVAIEREPSPMRKSTATYRITALSMPDRSVAPGTLMGRAASTADARKFDTTLYTKVIDGKLQSPANFIITLSDDGRLSLSHYRHGLRFSLWRMVPYMFRYSVRAIDERPKGTDGMVRLYPPSEKSSQTPRHL